MNRGRMYLGMLTGVMLLLSAAAHSLMGWPALAGEIAATNTPADLVQGIQVGWQFGGVSMLVFGALVIATFRARLAGLAAPMFPVAFVAIAYIGFGAWALYVSNFDPFFLVFVVPGALLAFALS